jgi:glycosyltransferase involved in cell wall biosynthesis
MRAYVAAVLGRVSRVIALCETVRDELAPLVPIERVIVVPNGINAPPRSFGRQPGREGAPFRVLSLGSLCAAKGTFVVLDAARILRHRGANVQVVLAGPWASAEDHARAERVIHNESLAGLVTMTGPVSGERKWALFGGADVFVFAGIQQEGQPLVVLEAMAAGLPVLYTNRGCLRSTVQDGRNGFEIPVGDPAALAERILWLMTHTKECRRLSEASRLRYEENFTMAGHVHAMSEVLVSVTQSGPRSRAQHKAND